MQTISLLSAAAKQYVGEAIKYAGSKKRLLPHILQLVASVRPRRVIDAFSGTTRVSRAFAHTGYEVIANDIAVWSEVFATCYLRNKRSAAEYEELIEHLNALPPVEGWFTEHYGGDSNRQKKAGGRDGTKRPWQRHNTMRLDAIREEIDSLNLAWEEKCTALTSLIHALDQVDSTLGHYASYLNDWSPRSYGNLRLKVPTFEKSCIQHSVYRQNVFAFCANPDVAADVAYLDPPYGSNNEKMPPSRVRYASYYHLWTTICLNDRPELFGVANRRVDTSDKVAVSEFEEFRRNDSGRFIAVDAIHRLLVQIPARHIVLSYSSGGRATAREINEAILDCGRLVDLIEIGHKRNVMAGMRWTSEWIRDAEEPNTEFLFLIEKSGRA